MHIALYHWGQLPPAEYGGTERVVTWLSRGLAELGHAVTVVAGRGSRLPWARVVEVEPRAAQAPDFDLRPLLPAGLDVLLASAPLRRDPGLPWVFHLHGNSRPGVVRPPNTVYLSADHARRHGAVAYVHNGLDPAELTFRAVKEGYDLFLGRLHAIKGWRWAVQGCRRSGRRLVVAGGWRPSLRRGLRFVGSVGGARKAELLAGARLLWMPALWDEPFGLTLIEALASGTPVLGTRRGALPEIVTPDVGRLGETLDELVAAADAAARAEPEACRDRVMRHFHYRVMAAGHLRMLTAYLRDGVLPAGRLLDGPDDAGR
ncbi:MAG TPA: glycosyltransferase [Gemmatimonadales bacterium]|jgi:glycosyltransferase involved in cell wall biosynthesis|nr:glycosyltransferase [Gemmatimonadales bacterium]